MPQKNQNQKGRHTVRNVLIVIAVILILIIIGCSTGSNDDTEEQTEILIDTSAESIAEKETETEIHTEIETEIITENETEIHTETETAEPETEIVTEAVTEMATESETEKETETEKKTADTALMEYVESNTNGFTADTSKVNRTDLLEYLKGTYSEDEAINAVDNAEIDWSAYALEYENYLLKDDAVYHEDGLRKQLAVKGFTQDEIDYAIANVDWSLQKDILDFIEDYTYLGIEEDPDDPSKTNMFWSVHLNEDAKTYWWNDDDFIEAAKACMHQPETKANYTEGYGIQVYDANGLIIYSWMTYVDKYTIYQYDWPSSSSNPNVYEWKLTDVAYNEIINTRQEG